MRVVQGEARKDSGPIGAQEWIKTNHIKVSQVWLKS